jgi:hypothetical protein
LKDKDLMKLQTMKTTILAFFLLPLALTIACHKTEQAPEPVHAAPEQKLPVTQVVQTVNVSFDSAWPLIISTLKNRNLSIKLADPSKGQILVDWIEVRDELCGSLPRTHAQLSCRVRLVIGLQSISARASSFSVNYYEECYDRKAMNLECPGSNAEKILLSVTEDLKRILGASE